MDVALLPSMPTCSPAGASALDPGCGTATPLSARTGGRAGAAPPAPFFASPGILDLLQSPQRAPATNGGEDDPFNQPSPNFNGLVTPEWARAAGAASAAARRSASRRLSGDSLVVRRLDVDAGLVGAAAPGHHAAACAAAVAGAAHERSPYLGDAAHAAQASPRSLSVSISLSAGGLPPAPHLVGLTQAVTPWFAPTAAGGGLLQPESSARAAMLDAIMGSGMHGVSDVAAVAAAAVAAAQQAATLTAARRPPPALVLQPRSGAAGAAMLAAAAAEVAAPPGGAPLSSSAVRMKLHALLGSV